MATGTDRPFVVESPGASRRATRRFRSNLGPASAWLTFGVVVETLLIVTLVIFDNSLDVSSTQRAAARVIEVLLALGGLSAPYAGARAVISAVHARGLARSSTLIDARVAVEDSRDWIWYVVGFGLTTATIAFLTFLVSAHGGQVREVMFNFSLMWNSRTALLRGFWINIKLMIVGEILVLIWALVVAIVKQLPGRATAPIRWLATAYTDVLRGVPAIIVILLVVFGFDLAGVPGFTSIHDNDQRIFVLGVVALTLVYGAYVAEVYRAGLESIHWSQMAAARSLGLSQWQSMRHVIVPQAVRRIVPPLLNDFVALQKDTALVGFAGVLEILNIGEQLNSKHFNLSPITMAAAFFLVITIPQTRAVDYLIKRDQERTRAG